jgi:hypothetical protein
MRSQVQVLAGPPPIVAGQSTAGSEPGALAAGLGRAGAARPSPSAPPLAPPGPPTRASASATTTHRGRAPSRGRQPRGGCRHLAAACSRAHRAAARDGRSARRPGLPGRSAGKRGRRGPHPTRRPGSATDLPLTNATWAASPAYRPSRPGFPTPPPELGGDGRVRMDGGRHQTAGHRTGGQQTGDRRALWTTSPGDRTPDGWTAGSRTPRPDGWTPMLDTGDRRRGVPAGRVDHGDHARPLDTQLDTPLGRRGQGEHQPGPLNSKDAEGTHAATDGPGHRRDVSCKWYAAVPLAPWRTAVLGRLRVERRASGSRSSVMAGADTDR